MANLKIKVSLIMGALLMVLTPLVISCDLSGGITVTPKTLPGLFVNWRLVEESFECEQGNSVNTPSSTIVLSLRNNYSYQLVENGSTIKEGSFIIEGERISFSPPIFESGLSAYSTYAFNGSDLLIRNTELSSAGGNDFCEVERTYKQN